MNKPTEAVYAGIRRFQCDECGNGWDEPSRCYFSPSSECCDECGGYTSPFEGLPVKGILFNARGGVEYKEVVTAANIQYPDARFNFG